MTNIQLATAAINTINDLKSHSQWVCWLPDKTPINPRTGGNAKANISSTWSTYDQARARWQSDRSKYAGLGYELIIEQCLTVIDLDKCIDEQGILAPWARAIVDRMNSYAEISPSGRGVHIWTIGSLPNTIGPDPTGRTKVEMYDCKRYMTITGNHVEGTPDTFQNRQDELLQLHEEITEARRQAKELDREKEYQAKSTHTLSQDRQPGDSRYGIKALEKESSELAAAMQPGRNHRLNQAAFAMGQLVGGNELTRHTVEEALRAACRANGLYDEEPDKVDATMKSGLESGIKKPRKAPEKEAAAPNTPRGNMIPPEHLCRFTDDDAGNGDAMYEMFGLQFLYTTSHGWLSYNGTHWVQDKDTSEVKKKAVETLRARRHAAVDLGKEAIIKCTKADDRKVNGCINRFRSLVASDIELFDNNPDLINCQNGVVDLRTKTISPHDPAQLFTYCVPVPYESSDYHEYEEYLQDVVGGGQEVIDYLQMAAGYSLTGHTREECLFYLYGPPRSGKGTFSEVMMALLPSPLTAMPDFNSFTAKRSDNVNNFDLAPLKPCRMVFASESNRYQSLNPAKIKQMTGGDKIPASFKHKDMFYYRPQFKVWMLSNWPVNGDPEDNALWSRVRVIEFPNSFLGKEDKSKKERLKSPEALKGILYWAVEGAYKWYALGSAGLQTPDAVMKTTKAQQADLDYVRQWLDDRAEQNAEAWTPNDVVIKSYTEWCKSNNVEFVKDAKRLAMSLQSKGYQTGVQKKVDGKNTKGVRGLKIESSVRGLWLVPNEEQVEGVTGNGSNGKNRGSSHGESQSEEQGDLPLLPLPVTDPLPSDVTDEVKANFTRFKRKFGQHPGKIMWTCPGSGIPNDLVTPEQWWSNFKQVYSNPNPSVRLEVVEELRKKVDA